MQVVAANECAQQWREDGDPARVPVVFSSSLGTDTSFRDHIVPDLHDGFRFIRYDTRGQVLPERPCRSQKTGTLVADVEAHCESLARTGLSATIRSFELLVLVSDGSEDGAYLSSHAKQTVHMFYDAKFEVLTVTGHLFCVKKSVGYADILSRFLKEHANE